MDQLRLIIKAARIAQNKSLKELADALDVTVTALEKFENEGSIELEVLLSLVNQLNVAPEAVQPFLDEMGWNIVDGASEKQIDLLLKKSRA